MRRRNNSLIAILSLLLASCSGLPTAPEVDTRALEAEALAALARGDNLTARERYEALAAAASGEQRQLFRIELARTELALGNPQAALGTLNAIVEPLSPQAAFIETSLRAEILFALGRTVEAVSLLVERDPLLNSADDILANQTLIWDGLARAPDGTGTTLTGDATVDGWLALAPLTRLPMDSDAFLAELAVWRTEYTSHPAMTGILADRLFEVRAPGQELEQLALLLPTGARSVFSPQARAVRDGFMAAHFATGQLDTTSVTLYDTSVDGGAESYRAALRDGADFIVGPLVSDEIPQVLAQAGFVPTLALNVSAGETASVPQFYQFALASDDEVQAVAARAIAEGHRTAVVLHASSNFGYNVRDSFQAAFEAAGGTVIASRVYANDSGGISIAPMEELLNISQSEQRFARLDNILTRPIQGFEPRRRGDIDMIFLQIDQPAAARLLVPQLEAYTAATIPTYSTRDAFDPVRTTGSSELDGLRFPDLPLLLQPVGEAAIAMQALAAYSNQYAEQFPREFAFGFDAYLLAAALFARDEANWPLAGATGELHLNPGGRVRRVLPIAEFERGQPRVREAATAFFTD